MIATWVALALISAQDVPSFERAMSLATESRYAEALATAEKVDSAVERERVRLHVLWAAGDLGGAFRAARAGLAEDPQDPWLLERATALALSLGAAESAAESLDALRSSLNELPEEHRASYQPSVEAHQVEVARLLGRFEAQQRAATRARMVVIAGAALALAAWIYGASGRASGRRDLSEEQDG